jgi:UTP--glucose-1-phosphate uridylyltransferase
MKRITTAVIPIGGLGTRFYPITKTVRKYLLPVYDRPVVDYLLDNCIDAGLSRVIFVTSEGDDQIAHYLNEDLALRKALIDRGKGTVYTTLIEPLHGRIKTVVIEQPSGDPVGTSPALIRAKDQLDRDEPFIVMMGDDFLWKKDSGSDLKDLIDSFYKAKASAACLVERVKTFAEIEHKAAVVTYPTQNGFNLMRDIIEKPAEDKFGRLISFGPYLFTWKIFDAIATQKPNPKTGEMCLADAIRILCRTDPVLVQEIKGKHFDCGTPDSWLATNNFVRRAIMARASQSAPR